MNYKELATGCCFLYKGALLRKTGYQSFSLVNGDLYNVRAEEPISALDEVWIKDGCATYENNNPCPGSRIGDYIVTDEGNVVHARTGETLQRLNEFDFYTVENVTCMRTKTGRVALHSGSMVEDSFPYGKKCIPPKYRETQVLKVLGNLKAGTVFKCDKILHIKTEEAWQCLSETSERLSSGSNVHLMRRIS